MIVKQLAEHHLEFLSLKGGCRGSSESTLVKLLEILLASILNNRSLNFQGITVLSAVSQTSLNIRKKNQHKIEYFLTN